MSVLGAEGPPLDSTGIPVCKPIKSKACAGDKRLLSGPSAREEAVAINAHSWRRTVEGIRRENGPDRCQERLVQTNLY